MGAVVAVATLNLYHYASPDVWWYGVDPEGAARHTARSWTAKRLWLSCLLREMDADLVGFQEVVAVEDLRALAAEAGYPHFFAAGTPRIEASHGERVYVRPVQAIASRLPMRAFALSSPAGFAERMELHRDWDFRRPPAVAEVETALGPVWIACAHLKSPGAPIDEGAWAARLSDDMTPEARAREIAEARARGHAASVRQRAAEAAALQQAAFDAMAEQPDRGAIALGDFNAPPASPTLSALRAASSEREAGEAARFWRLHDAADLAPPSQIPVRPATHRGGGAGTAIDFVMVSSLFAGASFDDASEAPARVIEHRVFDAHLRDGSDPASTSDHAAVRVRLRRDPNQDVPLSG